MKLLETDPTYSVPLLIFYSLYLKSFSIHTLPLSPFNREVSSIVQQRPYWEPLELYLGLCSQERKKKNNKKKRERVQRVKVMKRQPQQQHQHKTAMHLRVRRKQNRRMWERKKRIRRRKAPDGLALCAPSATTGITTYAQCARGTGCRFCESRRKKKCTSTWNTRKPSRKSMPSLLIPPLSFPFLVFICFIVTI